MSTNYFTSAPAAERYARARPDVHPAIMARVAPRLGGVERALDVGCGTGMSTVALAALAGSVAGVDPSRQMLRWARQHPRVRYAASPAEALPFRAGAFGLVSAGMAFHWFDRPRFLAEARRVLRGEGWLLVYNAWFDGRMRENAAFAGWFGERYLARYPNPPRHSSAPSPEDAKVGGFALVEKMDVEQDVTLSPAALADYLSTQSNVIAAVEHGRESLDEALGWLMRSLEPLFPSPAATFPFGASVWLLRRRDGA